MNAKRSGESRTPVPCLFYEGRCGVVRSVQGRRLYHFECVEQVVRDSAEMADLVRRITDYGSGGSPEGDDDA